MQGSEAEGVVGSQRWKIFERDGGDASIFGSKGSGHIPRIWHPFKEGDKSAKEEASLSSRTQHSHETSEGFGRSGTGSTFRSVSSDNGIASTGGREGSKGETKLLSWSTRWCGRGAERGVEDRKALR